jgi:hypothetical protein
MEIRDLANSDVRKMTERGLADGDSDGGAGRHCEGFRTPSIVVDEAPQKLEERFRFLFQIPVVTHDPGKGALDLFKVKLSDESTHHDLGFSNRDATAQCAKFY